MLTAGRGWDRGGGPQHVGGLPSRCAWAIVGTLRLQTPKLTMTLRPLCLTLALLLSLSLQAPAPPAEGGHVTRELQGWTVRVHPELAVEGSELGESVLGLLDNKLAEVVRLLPAKAVEQLRGVVIWMELDHEGVPGGVYHPSREWLVEHGYSPELARCVQFGNAENFLSWTRSQPFMVVHELSHAYHHQVIGYEDEGVREAYERARDAGDYDAVLRYGGSHEKAYGMNNRQEYFAELSEAYFGTNDFYPFVRPELAEHDPQGFAAIQAAWGL